jgi:hypothetical protein
VFPCRRSIKEVKALESPQEISHLGSPERKAR